MRWPWQRRRAEEPSTRRTIQLRGGHTTADPRLDRLPEFDDLSRAYAVRQSLEAVPLPRKAKAIAAWPPVHGLDQGQEGACVLFSKAHRLNGSPRRRVPPVTPQQAYEWYWQVQEEDQWPETHKGGAGGTSVLAACRYLARIGEITRYEWVGAGSGDVGADIVDTLHFIGGINFGLGWTPSMFRPRPSGLIEVDTSGGFSGGHAVHAFSHTWKSPLKGEGSKAMDLIWIQQSWGPDHGVTRYGVAGIICVKTEDLVNKLMLAPRPWAGEGAVILEPTS